MEIMASEPNSGTRVGGVVHDETLQSVAKPNGCEHHSYAIDPGRHLDEHEEEARRKTSRELTADSIAPTWALLERAAWMLA